MSKHLLLLASSILPNRIYTAPKLFSWIERKVKVAIFLIIALSLTEHKKLYAQDDQNIEPRYTVELTERDYRALQEVILIKKNEWLAEIQRNNPAENKNSYMSIQYPYELTESEKTMGILERISNKYIGELPEKINDVIAYFYGKTKGTLTTRQSLMVNTALLCGEPGTGKTYLVKTLAQELQIPYMYCNCTAFLDKYFGGSADKIVNFFTTAKNANTPMLLFIDEIDAIALSRESNQSCGETLMTLLTEIQNIAFNPNIFIFIATNTPERLDSAFMNRFSGQIIKIEKLQKKELLIQFFKKSLRDNGFTLEQEIESLAHDIYSELYGWAAIKIFAPKFSLRELEKIVPNLLARKYNYEILQNKPTQNFTFYIKQAIRDITNDPLNQKTSKRFIGYTFVLAVLAHTLYAISHNGIQQNYSGANL